MAEGVRQVEVGCAERGRLLAAIWNAYTATLAATIELQQGQLQQLAGANANLEAGEGPAAGLNTAFTSHTLFLSRPVHLPACLPGRAFQLRVNCLPACLPGCRGLAAAMEEQQFGVPAQGNQPPAQGVHLLHWQRFCRFCCSWVDANLLLAVNCLRAKCCLPTCKLKRRHAKLLLLFGDCRTERL
jgi:hypothetical protein